MSLVISTSNGSVFRVFYDYIFSLISNYFCDFTEFVLLIYMFLSTVLEIPMRFFF